MSATNSGENLALHVRILTSSASEDAVVLSGGPSTRPAAPSLSLPGKPALGSGPLVLLVPLAVAPLVVWVPASAPLLFSEPMAFSGRIVFSVLVIFVGRKVFMG
jgi:hypothetical protein